MPKHLFVREDDDEISEDCWHFMRVKLSLEIVDWNWRRLFLDLLAGSSSPPRVFDKFVHI